MMGKDLRKRDLKALNDSSLFNEEILLEVRKDIDSLIDKKPVEDKRIIDKNARDYDFSTLDKILKKREENKNVLSMLKKKNMELDVFYEIIKKSEDLPYSIEELYRIYKNILD